MFSWLQGKQKSDAKASLSELGADSDFDSLLKQDLVVLFKHSHACPVSWAAHSQVTRFLAHHPDVSVYLIPVIKERAFSRRVAAAIDVEHESPQVIVLRRGVVTEVASHGDITEAELLRMVEAKS